MWLLLWELETFGFDFKSRRSRLKDKIEGVGVALGLMWVLPGEI
jgi:hypothetical protein